MSKTLVLLSLLVTCVLSANYDNLLIKKVNETVHSDMYDEQPFKPEFYAKKVIIRNYVGPLMDETFNFMPEMEELHITTSIVLSLFRGTLQTLKKLHTFDISYSSVAELYNEFFQNCPSLKKINIHHNSIDSIENDTFTYLPNLEKLQITGQNIPKISKQFLEGSIELREILIHKSGVLTTEINYNGLNFDRSSS